MRSSLALLATFSVADAVVVSFATVTTKVVSTVTPLVFQTTPEVFAGTTATGVEPFLIQTNPAPFSKVSYSPASPLETQEPIKGAPKNANIFHLMGNMSPYHPADGFGVDEYPIPDGAKVSWLNTIHRHGSRYPTDPLSIAYAIEEAQKKGAKFSGKLDFVNSWKYQEGVNILTPWGRQECYDSGVLHNYQYGGLFDPNSTTKLIARTTTEDRMRKTAENFLAGFFGLGWNEFANLEFIIDETGYNNSLAGYNACLNNNNYRTSAGDNASDYWTAIYSKDAVKRLNSMSKGLTWNSSLVYDAQELCAYETVSLGYSAWCDLFTYKEWEDFEQAIDLSFYGTYGFGSPTGRAVGIGYVEEVLARIDHHVLKTATGSANITYDNMTSTFPLDQVLNFDFSHDVNIFAVLTAFGFKQFQPIFSNSTYAANRSVNIGQMIPFGCRLDIEIIDSPSPISASRNGSSAYEALDSSAASGNGTQYIAFKLNQRTLPLYESYPSCEKRADGWCELSTWLKTQKDALAESDYAYSCDGDYAAPGFGAVTNGVPPTKKS